MRACLILIALLGIGLASCGKVKTLADKASSAVKEQITSKKAKVQVPTTDNELQKLVDQTAEGVIFRKDLPFPEHLEVIVTSQSELSGRSMQTSEFGKESRAQTGTFSTVTKLERTGNQVRVTRQQSTVTAKESNNPEAGKTKDKDKTTETSLPLTKPYTLRKTGKTWKSADGNNFASAYITKQLAPVFEPLLVENSVYPRRFWFAKRRLKIGDQLDLSGEAMPMLQEGTSKGSFHLKLLALEAVEGHPCGVFEVTGDYSGKQFPDFDGGFTDEDVSIQSGKLWLSLLYPVILKGEMDTVKTTSSGTHGNLVSRGQGACKRTFTHSWKPLRP